MPFRSVWQWLREPHHFFSVLLSLLPLLLIIRFMQMYILKIPIIDHWTGSLYIAVAARQGTLTLGDITAVHGGHWHLLTNISTVLFGLFTPWDVQLETWINLILAVINFLLLAYLFSRQSPRLLFLFLPLLALFVFEVQQDGNWLNSYYSVLHYVNTFFLLSLVIMVSRPISWLTLTLILLCTLLATLSLTTGIFLWAMMPVVLWLWGYRQQAYFIVWVVIAALVIYVYQSELRATAERGPEGWAEPQFVDPITQARFIFAFLGSPLTLTSLDLAGVTALCGLALTLANLYLYWQWRQNLQEVAVWLALIGFAGGAATLTSFGRLRQLGLESALSNRYAAAAMMLWITFVALAILNGWHFFRQQRLRHPVIYANSLLLIVMLACYGYSNLSYLQAKQPPLNTRYTNAFMNEEYCVMDYVLVRENLYGCYGTGSHATPETVYMAAAYQLSIFEHRPPVNILPETYEADSPVIVHSPATWLNLYMQWIMLDGLSSDSTFHIAPPPERFSLEKYGEPLPHYAATLDDAVLTQLDTFIGAADQVWLVTVPEKESENQPFFAWMEDQGYVATPYPIQHERYRTARFNVYRFQQPPQDTETIFAFGEERISLQSWSVSRGDSRIAPTSDPAETVLEVAPCESIRVQSWWQSEAVPTYNYSTTFVLLAPDGNAVAQKDAAIGDTLMQLWQPGQFYFDERILTLPCDAAPGDYTLVVGIYNNTGSGFEDLTAVDAEGADLGTRAPVSRLMVRAP